MRPLAFLRQMFCLNNNLGSACNATTHLDVLSHHPINVTNPPDYRAINHDDIEVADFHKLVPLDPRRRADRSCPAERSRTRSGPRSSSWFSKPPSTIGLPPATQARWLEQGLYLLWKQGASVAINFLLRDTTRVTSFSGASGVFFYDGQQKPSYTSFRFPFVTHRISKSSESQPGARRRSRASSRSRGMPPAVG